MEWSKIGEWSGYSDENMVVSHAALTLNHLRVSLKSTKIGVRRELGASLVQGICKFTVNLEPNLLLTPSEVQILGLKIHPLDALIGNLGCKRGKMSAI